MNFLDKRQAGGARAAAAASARSPLAQLQAYGISLACVAAAALVNLSLWDWIRPQAAPLFLVAVLLSAWYGGLGPGMAAALLATIAGAAFYQEPILDPLIEIQDLLATPVFLFTAVLGAWLVAARPHPRGLQCNLSRLRALCRAAAATRAMATAADDDVQIRALPLAGARRLPDFSPALAVLLVLLLADLFYVAAHVAALLASWRDGRWLISQDGGYAEQFQYQKFLLLALLTGLWALWQRRPALLVWTAVFALLWVDDKFLVHEYFGLHFADLAARALNDPGHIPLHFGPLAAKHVGELIAAGGMGLALLALIAVAYRNGGATFRRLSVRLVVVLLALGVCGVAFDLLHHIPGVESARLFGHRWLAQALTLLEDGGEMLVITAGVYIVLTAIDAAEGGEGAIHL